MKKPSKERIDEVAKKLFFVFYREQLKHAELEAAWGYKFNPGFHRMAKLVLTELQPVPALHSVPVAKSCKLVHGKAVCR